MQRTEQAERTERAEKTDRTTPAEQYTERYFAAQLSKSDEKLAWYYGTVFAMAGAQPQGRVLDVGCGAGPGVRYLAARGNGAVFGVDLMHYPLVQAQQRAAVAGLVQADVEYSLPFASESFDLLLLSELVEHLPNARPLLYESCRVLRHGGRIIVTTPNMWDMRRFLEPLTRRTWSGHADPTHVNLYTPTRLVDDLVSAGFDDVRWHTGIKPLVWLSSRRLGVRVGVPYPPAIGNGLLATGVRAV